MRAPLRRACLAMVFLSTATAPAVAQAPEPGADQRFFVAGGQQGQRLTVVGGQQVADPGGQLTADAFSLEAIESGAPVIGAPYVAEATTEIVQPLVDGNRIVRRASASLYRDSRGRTRREVTLADIAGIIVKGSPLKTITISDPAAGTMYFLDADKRDFVTQVRMDPSRGGSLPPPPSRLDRANALQPARTANIAREESLGTREIQGIRAEGTRTTVTIPAGAIGNERAINSVSERWFSPELQIVVLSRRTDPRFGETTYQVTKITRAEPPATLFEWPAR